MKKLALFLAFAILLFACPIDSASARGRTTVSQPAATAAPTPEPTAVPAATAQRPNAWDILKGATPTPAAEPTAEPQPEATAQPQPEPTAVAVPEAVSGSVTLVETQNAGFDLAACDIVIPDGFWAYSGMEKPSDAEIAALIGMGLETAEVFSVSPTADSALIASHGGVFALNGSTLTALCPNEERGVADAYGNMRKVYQNGLRMLLDVDGVVWSPDGRYAVMTSYRTSLVNGNYIIDPMLIDTVTGDMFLTATYGTKPVKHEDAGTVTAACFSADGRYLYYTFWGNLGDLACSLLRFDMESGETEFLYNGDTNIYYPRLWALRDGSLMILSDVRSKNDPMGVARLYKGSSSAFWNAVSSDLANRAGAAQFWHASVTRFNLNMLSCRPTYLDYSSESGCALCIVNMSGVGGYALSVFQPDEAFEGLNRRWLLTSDTNELVPAPEGEEAVSGLFVQDESGFPVLRDEYLPLHGARISPDGRFALVQAGRGEDIRLYLISLDEVTVRPVQGVGPMPAYNSALANGYRPGMEWHGEEILILTNDGLKSFRIAD